MKKIIITLVITGLVIANICSIVRIKTLKKEVTRMFLKQELLIQKYQLDIKETELQPN